MTDDDFNRRNIEEFRANHGRLGGQFEGAPVLLLHTKGARSGEERVNPMMYMADGDRYLVFASAAGADRNPAGTTISLLTPTPASRWGTTTSRSTPSNCTVPNATPSTRFRPSATRVSPVTSAKPPARYRFSPSSPRTLRHE